MGGGQLCSCQISGYLGSALAHGLTHSLTSPSLKNILAWSPQRWFPAWEALLSGGAWHLGVFQGLSSDWDGLNPKEALTKFYRFRYIVCSNDGMSRLAGTATTCSSSVWP